MSNIYVHAFFSLTSYFFDYSDANIAMHPMSILKSRHTCIFQNFSRLFSCSAAFVSSSDGTSTTSVFAFSPL